MYQEEQEQKEEDFEYKLDIEKWQVDEVTSQGIFVTVDFGIDQKGQIKIPARMLDQNEDGTFTAYVQTKRISFTFSILTTQIKIAISQVEL